MKDPAQAHAVLDATWPAAGVVQIDGWTIREGQGGGQRVSAASGSGDIAQAEAAMRALGQPPLFMIRGGDDALDTALAAQRYVRHDPVIIYAAKVATLTNPAPSPMSAFPVWPPLAIAVALWDDAGIDAGRRAVMDRVSGPKTSILGRIADRAAGVAFVACHQGVAMLHALEVVPNLRRQGLAAKIMRIAAIWAQDQGADTFCVAVAAANAPACALYEGLGMDVIGHYHYRKLP
jgi:GNAT superfamily N-acetyltransferase